MDENGEGGHISYIKVLARTPVHLGVEAPGQAAEGLPKAQALQVAQGRFLSKIAKTLGTSARAAAEGPCTAGRPGVFSRSCLKVQGRPPVYGRGPPNSYSEVD